MDDDYLWEVVAENVTSIDIREDRVEGDLWEAVDRFVGPDNVVSITDATMARLMASRDHLRGEIRDHIKAGERYSLAGPLTPNDVAWDLVSEVIADEMYTLFNQPAFWRGLITTVESETIPGMTPDTEKAG